MVTVKEILTKTNLKLNAASKLRLVVSFKIHWDKLNDKYLFTLKNV